LIIVIINYLLTNITQRVKKVELRAVLNEVALMMMMMMMMLIIIMFITIIKIIIRIII